MKRHLVLVTSLLAAVVCYGVGWQHAALALVVVGMLFETVFWFYLLAKPKSKPPPSN